jgi:hypothetical protein
MKLVVAGLGRSGTQSLVAACKRLGLKTLSQEDFVADPELLQHVLDVVEGKRALEFDRLAGVDATIGWPVCWTYAAQLEHWPEAACLLNVRDPDAWFESIAQSWKTMGMIRRLPRIGTKLRAMNRMLDVLVQRMGSPKPEREAWTRGYRAHINGVEASVRPSRLTRWTMGDGWTPLCEALGVPVPEARFPDTQHGSEELHRRALSFIRRR